MTDEINVLNAMDNDGQRETVEHIVTLIRAILAPLMNENQDRLPELQSYSITAAALFAGMSLGHMIALGVAKDQDKRRAGQVVLTNFRNGIEIGKNEVRKAMLEQLPAEGRA